VSNLAALINGDRINLERITFLLLDANQQSLDILGQIVSGFGARTIVKCQTVKEARSTVGRMNIDFLIADAHLPNQDGYAFLKWLRSETGEPNKFAPAVLVSGDASERVVRRSRDAGAHFVVAKPITPKILLERIFWIARENRPFIDCATYVGPDRRFKRLGPPAGIPGRRHDDVRTSLRESAGPNLSQDEINAMMKPSKVNL
jgi:CheY-like chemotaxis protein